MYDKGTGCLFMLLVFAVGPVLGYGLGDLVCNCRERDDD